MTRWFQICFRLCATVVVFAGAFLPGFAQNVPEGTKDQYAGIVIDSRGTKLYLIETEAGLDGQRQVEKLTELGNVEIPGLNQLAVATQAFDPAQMEETLKAVKAFHKQALEREIPAKRIWIAAGSDLKMASNIDDFANSLEEATGAHFDKIIPVKEVFLKFLDQRTVPSLNRFSAFLLDIDETRTKFGYADFANDGVTWIPFADQFPMGTESLTDQICAEFKVDPTLSQEELVESFAKAVHTELQDTQKVQVELANQLKSMQVRGRERFYLTGGIIWALRVLINPQRTDDSHVAITHKDIEAFRERVRRPVDEVFDVDLTGLPDDQREAAKKELENMKQVFGQRMTKVDDVEQPYAIPHANLIVGAELLLACEIAFGLDQENVEIKAPIDWKDAWIRGYAIERARKIWFEENGIEEKPFNPWTDPATDAVVQQLVKDVEANTKQLMALEDRLGKPDAADSDLVKLRAEISSLREEVRNLRSQSGASPRAAMPARPRAGNVKASPVAEQQFYRALDAAKNGDLASALASSASAADLEPSLRNMYCSALIQIMAGQKSECQELIKTIAAELDASREEYARLHRFFESFQGRSRRALEYELARLRNQ